MKHRLFVLFTVLVLAAALLCPVFAAQTQEKALVADEADVLTDAQEQTLENSLRALSDSSNTDLVVLTVSSLEGKTALARADDYFDYNGYGRGEDRSGMLLLYYEGVSGDREVAVSTRGSLMECVRDADSDAFLDQIIPSLQAGDFMAAFSAFVPFAEEEIAEIGQPKTLPLYYIPISLLIGFAAAFIILKIQTAPLKSVRKERTAGYYVDSGSLQISGSYDRFLYRNVTKRVRKQESATTGRVSSSGASHGGTSKKF